LGVAGIAVIARIGDDHLELGAFVTFRRRVGRGGGAGAGGVDEPAAGIDLPLEGNAGEHVVAAVGHASDADRRILHRAVAAQVRDEVLAVQYGVGRTDADTGFRLRDVVVVRIVERHVESERPALLPFRRREGVGTAGLDRRVVYFPRVGR